MKKIENECVDCLLPCLGSSCPHRNVERYYCDQCNEEAGLYIFDGQEMCADCILNSLEKVKESF